ncbi:MAG TPA: TrkH family potassium uptake protein, partial [Candidatus Treponema faecavium]|nr:TrkH family potassium uptake protein [Candidatus Treponema faecavium]
IVISLSGKDFLTCFTGTLLCLGNIGIGIGTIGTTLTFDQFSAPYMWVFSFLMLVGRLELFTVYSLFTRRFWAR